MRVRVRERVRERGRGRKREKEGERGRKRENESKKGISSSYIDSTLYQRIESAKEMKKKFCTRRALSCQNTR